LRRPNKTHAKLFGGIPACHRPIWHWLTFMGVGRSLLCSSTTWMPISNWRPKDLIASWCVNLERLFSEEWQPRVSTI